MKFLIDFKQFFIDIFKSLIISLFISLIIFGNYYIEERYRITTTICNKTFKWFVLVFVLLQIVFFLVRRFIPNFSKLIINCFKDNNQTYIPKPMFSINKLISFVKRRYISIIVFVFALFMMLFKLMYSPLWGDEWIEYRISQQSIFNGELFRSCGNTFQPPLYNLIMHCWLLISKDLLWFRLFNVVISVFSLVRV